jgi:hypothetical protein
MDHLEMSDHYVVKDEPVNEDVENVSKLTRIRNVLISEPDYFEPMGGGRFQLQTEDQNNIHNSGEKLYSLYNVRVVLYQKEGEVAYCCLTDESWNSGPRKGIHCWAVSGKLVSMAIRIKKKLCGLSSLRTIPTERSPLVGEVRANFCGERGCHVVSVTDPYGHILGFLDRNCYFFFQVAQLYSLG